MPALKVDGPLRALIVDDDDSIRRSICRALRLNGFECHEAGSADEALEILAASVPIDVICSDQLMPGSMTGLEFLSGVQRRWPDIITILMTGFVGDIFSESIPVLEKPFTIPGLTQLLNRLLSGRDTGSSVSHS